jgi:hypothetical protein
VEDADEVTKFVVASYFLPQAQIIQLLEFPGVSNFAQKGVL